MPEHPSALVAVIIVTWNGREQLVRCLRALERQTWRDRVTVVVDNASTDGTPEIVTREFPDVRLLANRTNLGFAAANNIGIRATDAPFVATLNNDAVPEPGWLEALVRMAEGDPTLGSVASRMVFARDPWTIDSCGVALDRAGIAWDLLGGYPAEVIDRPREVFGPCAGAALYRRTMLEDVGLFDEDYFAYLEDVDLAWRARLRGWRCQLAPDAVVRHEHAATLGDASPLKRYLLARNKVWTIAKCAPTPDLWRWLPVIVIYDVGAAAFGVARQGDWASVRGRLAGLATLGRALAKRREIQARRAVPTQEVVRWYAPLAAPWDVPRRYRHLTQPRVALGAALTAQEESSRAGGRVRARAQAVEAARVTPRFASTSVRAEARRWLLQAIGGLVHRAGASPRRARSRAAEPDRQSLRVLILRPDHLGDVLLSRPAVDLVLRSLPTAQVTVLVGPWGAPSLQGVPVRIVTFPFPGFTRAPRRSPLAPYAALLALATRVRREGYDAALILRPDHWWGALAMAAAGVPIRVGHATRDVAAFLTHAVAPVPREAAGRAALRAATALVRALGGEPVEPLDQAPRFSPSGAEWRRAASWLADHARGPAPRIAIHPGAGAAVKCWPAVRWARVVDALAPVATVFLCGAGEDAALVHAINRAARHPVPAALDLTWGTLAALYGQVDLVIGMDSGPMHLAAAVGTPTVRVYGPSDPRIYGPAGPAEQHRVLHADLPCVPCGDLQAPPCGHLLDPPCLAAVSVEHVVRSARADASVRSLV